MPVPARSLRHLTEEQRTVFALLGTAPGPDIDLCAAASLTGLPEARTHRALRVMEDHSLLDRHPHGRYSMHDLVRAYAATTADDHLPEPVRRAALERVVDFYRYTAHTADLLLYPLHPPLRLAPPAHGTHPQPLPDHPAALSWLDTHHAHLLAAQHTAATDHRHEAVWHLAWTLNTFHLRRGHRHDELAVWRAAADAAEHLSDPTTLIHARRRLGHAHAELGRHEQAITHLHDALAVAEHHHDPVQRARTHHALAWAWEQRGDHQQALEHADHTTPVTRIIAASPGLRLVVSYADTAQGHHGGIYQAGNWIYTGTTGSSDCYYVINGVKTHGRSVSSLAKPHKRPGETGIGYVRRTIDPDAYRLKNVPVKHRYAYPLNKTIRRRVAPMHKPYPQRAE